MGDGTLRQKFPPRPPRPLFPFRRRVQDTRKTSSVPSASAQSMGTNQCLGEVFFAMPPGQKGPMARMMMTKRGKRCFLSSWYIRRKQPKKKLLLLHLSTGLPDGREFFGVFWGCANASRGDRPKGRTKEPLSEYFLFLSPFSPNFPIRKCAALFLCKTVKTERCTHCGIQRTCHHRSPKTGGNGKLSFPF